MVAESGGTGSYLQGRDAACLLLLSVYLSSLSKSRNSSECRIFTPNSVRPSFLLPWEVARLLGCRPLSVFLALTSHMKSLRDSHCQAVASRVLSNETSRGAPLLSGAGHYMCLVLSVNITDTQILSSLGQLRPEFSGGRFFTQWGSFPLNTESNLIYNTQNFMTFKGISSTLSHSLLISYGKRASYPFLQTWELSHWEGESLVPEQSQEVAQCWGLNPEFEAGLFPSVSSLLISLMQNCA